MIILRSYEELVTYAADCLANEIEIDKVHLSPESNFIITIQGESWNEKIDIRGAKYVIELQRAFNNIYEKLLDSSVTDQPDKKKRTLVKVKIDKGSSLFKIDANEALTALLNSMTDTQAFNIAVLLICGTVSSFLIKKGFDVYENIKKKQEDEETKRRLVDVIGQATAIYPDQQKPMRALINTMSKDDTIVVPGEDQPLQASEIKKYYPKKAPLKLSTAYIDDLFSIKDIKYDDPVSLVLEKDSIIFKSTASLADEELEELYRLIKTKHQEGEIPPQLDLQVTANFTQRKIKSALLLGIGNKRERSKNLSDLVDIR